MEEGLAGLGSGWKGRKYIETASRAGGRYTRRPASARMPGLMTTSTIEITLKVPAEQAGQRLDQALAMLLPDYSRSRLKTWIESGEVQVDGDPAGRATRSSVARPYPSQPSCRKTPPSPRNRSRS